MTNLGAEVQRLNTLARAIGLFDDEDEEYRNWDQDCDTEGAKQEEEHSLLDDKDDNPVTAEGDAPAEGNGLVQMFCDCDSLELEELQVQTPDKRSDVLIKDLTLTVAPGESMLIMGGSGCGKTSLMRTIAGLWPKGGGVVRRPPDADTLFVPQSPYMVIGTLRQQLLYPHNDTTVTEEQLIEMLKFVKLGNLV